MQISRRDALATGAAASLPAFFARAALAGENADRILVMHEGRVTGEITDVAGATQERIMDLAVR